MFWSKKKNKMDFKTKDERTWRIENEIYRKVNELEKLYLKLDEIKEKGKREKNPNLQQLIANEYLQIDNKIKMQTIALKEMQKTYLQNQDYLNKEDLLETYKEIDNYTISSVADLRKIVVKIQDIQEKKQDDDKERQSINDLFEDNLDVYGASMEDDRAKSLTEMWARESEEEQLINETNTQETVQSTVEESKGDL